MNACQTRAVTVQGSTIRVHAEKQPIFYGGGGRRGKQQGFGARLSSRFKKKLFTFVRPFRVLWLTYPTPIGPSGVKKNVVALLKKLERRIKQKIPAVIKMEVQQRGAPEVSVIVWGEKIGTLDAGTIAELWGKTIREENPRVRYEPIQDWDRLASYVAKEVYYPFMATSGDLVTYSYLFLSKMHNRRTFPSSQDMVFPPPNICREWEVYSGRYHWFHNKALIPQQRAIRLDIPIMETERMRRSVNGRRTSHFIGETGGFTITGKEAVACIRQLPMGVENRGAVDYILASSQRTVHGDGWYMASMPASALCHTWVFSERMACELQFPHHTAPIQYSGWGAVAMVLPATTTIAYDPTPQLWHWVKTA